ncbi:MAG: peptide ABC transporter substrate-binding protein [Thermomicrobiales bacterium]
MVEQEKGQFGRAFEELKAGRISRRDFMEKAAALGVGLPVTLFVLQSLDMKGASAAPGAHGAGFRSAAQAAATRPTAGTENQQRGAGGELKLLQWQAVTHLSPLTGNGTKDYLGASLILEPLMSYMPDATVIATLVEEVPSVENGGLSEDLSTVTYKIIKDVKWSDGEPFTAKDVVFTWQWVMNPDNATTAIESYRPIKSVEAVDDLTAKITFNKPTLAWYVPFTGTFGGSVYPGHLWDFDPTKQGVIDTFRQNPVGTGPYVVDTFKENDQVIYKINDNYREPNKPFFAKVNLKGGGDAASAAQAVLQTGDYDYAWNLQVEPQILAQLQQGGKGSLKVVTGTSVERILFNFTDPNKEVDGQRAEINTPHPVFTDKAVRQAMSMLADRDTMSKQFYQGAPGEPPTSNALVGIPQYESKNTTWEYNQDKAAQILDQAGWTKNGDTRKKGDVEMNFSYSTSINAVRQKEQAVFKKSCEDVGIKLQLKQVDAGIFFDSAAGNEQTYTHFYNDLEMYTSSPGFSFPTDYMLAWYAGKDRQNIAQKSNGWNGQNLGRYANPDYDALYDQVVAETDPEKAADLFIKMNDMVINDFVIIPLVQRAADKYGISNTLRDENVALGPYESNYWNIANWNRTS